jgi:hypothetical protein
MGVTRHDRRSPMLRSLLPRCTPAVRVKTAATLDQGAIDRPMKAELGAEGRVERGVSEIARPGGCHDCPVPAFAPAAVTGDSSSHARSLDAWRAIARLIRTPA